MYAFDSFKIEWQAVWMQIRYKEITSLMTNQLHKEQAFITFYFLSSIQEIIKVEKLLNICHFRYHHKR